MTTVSRGVGAPARPEADAAPGDFHARLRAYAKADPSRVALTFAPVHRDFERIDVTYGELVARAEALAACLLRRLQVGDRALLLLPATPEFAVSFLGCLAAGVIAVPVPPPVNEAARRRVLNVAEDSGTALIVSLSFVHELLAAGPPEVRPMLDRYEWLLVDTLAEGGGAALLPDVSADEIAFLQYTSGSTTTPRGVMVTRRGLLFNEAAISEAFGVSSDSTIVSWLPLHHDMGLVGGLLQPLYAGARGVVHDPVSFMRRPASWLRTISDERADISGGPNFAYDLCARTVGATAKAGLDLSCWRVAFNGAAQVFPRTLRAFSDAFRDVGFRDSAHVPCYGLAEATLFVARGGTASSSRSAWFSAESLERGVAREAPDDQAGARELVAYALPRHATVRVVDPVTLAPVRDGRVGEIVVAGMSNGAGYWGDPSASTATFGASVDGDGAAPFVRTGDLGLLHRGHLYVVGRAKDLVVHRGRNLYPEDLEADVAACDPSFRTCAVFGVEDDGDEAVVVCQEIRARTPRDRYRELVDRIRTTLSAVHAVTAHTVVLLPPRTVDRTSSGKVQRYAVRRRFLAGQLEPLHTSTLAAARRPASRLADRLPSGFADLDRDAQLEEMTGALCDHLQALLGLPDRPSGHEAFASLGVDSLVAVQLQHEVEEALGVGLRPTELLRASSIAELAEGAVDRSSAARAEAPVGDDATAVQELTASQRALWFLQRAFPDSFAYNVTRAFRLTGAVDLAAVEAALATVVARHPSLRLSVLTVEGRPRAVVRPDASGHVDVVDARSWTSADEAEWYRAFATQPFDLERDPLLRAAALRRQDDVLLVLSLHHIVCDVASLALVVSELAEAYASGAEPPDAVSTRERRAAPAERERTVLAEHGERLGAFWREQLAGELPTLSLPRVGAVPPAREWRGAGTSIGCTVAPGLAGALTAFARESGLTVHNVLLAAFQVLLHRLGAQPDLLVGVPTLGRDDRALASHVGYLVNVVPIRSSFTPGASFAEFARRTQERVLDAVDHHDLPLSEITRLVNPDRAGAERSLFQAMFSYYAPALPGGEAAAAAVMADPDTGLSLGSAALYGHPVPEHTAQSDVCMNVVARRGSFDCEFQYDVDRVSREQAELLAASFTTLLEGIAGAPETPVRRLPLVTQAEARALVDASNGPRVPRSAHYLDSVEEMAARRPDAQAVDDGDVRMSYREVDERANHVARQLRARGVGVDTNVVVCAERSASYLVTLLGIHKADGCYVPISPTEAPRRAAGVLSALEPAACVADRAGRRLLRKALAGSGGPAVLDLAELTAGRNAAPPPRLAPALGASYIIQTSGSTGVPKSAISTNAGLTNHMWQMVEYFDLGPEDCVGQTAPVSFDVSIWQLLTPLLFGGRARVVPEPAALSPAQLLEATLTGGVTLLELVPSVVAALLDAGLADDPGALRIMIATGEALGADLPRRWRRELPGIPLYNAYGPAECTDDVSIGLSAFGPDAPTSVSIGRPLSNTSMLVVDDELVPVPVGVVGRLCVGGGGVGRGYHGDPRRTAQAFVPDPWSDVPGARLYDTGDLARKTTEGDVEFLGRVDTQIKIRGVRVEPGEVEAALRECPDVVDAAVKLHGGAAGTVLAGYVVLVAEDHDVALAQDGAELLAPAEDERLRALLAERLPRQMIPTVLARVPRLPRSANGKVDYRALQYLDPGRLAPEEPGRFDDPLSASVRSVWAELLERDVSWGDSFFRLGGHSLLALAMIDRVGRALDVELDVDTVFARPRLSDFVDAVRRADGTAPYRRPPSARAAPDVDVPASAAQQRFWFLHEIDPERPTYNMPGVLRMRGELDEAALEGALRDTLDRHRVLLARFSDEHDLTWTGGSGADFALPLLDLRGTLAELGDDALDVFLEGEANKPFDLRRERPFRAVLARVGVDDWRLFVTIDHIVCDGWSLSVFLSDLAEGYNERVRGAARRRSEAGYSFADFCLEERDWLEARGPAAAVAPWRGVADGPVSLSPVPASAQPSGRPGAERHSTWLDDDVADALRAFAGRTGTTPFIVFATAVSALAHSGAPRRETILLGTLIAQRDRPEWQRLVGPLLNVSVLATPLAQADTAADAIARTQDAALRAYRARHVPFQEIARRFPAAPGGDGSPFEVMLLMQPPGATPAFDGLATELVDLDPAAAPYPLSIDVEPVGDAYRVSYRYATDRYDRADVEALAVRLPAAIAAIVAEPETPLEALLGATEARAAGS